MSTKKDCYTRTSKANPSYTVVELRKMASEAGIKASKLTKKELCEALDISSGKRKKPVSSKTADSKRPGSPKKVAKAKVSSKPKLTLEEFVEYNILPSGDFAPALRSLLVAHYVKEVKAVIKEVKEEELSGASTNYEIIRRCLVCSSVVDSGSSEFESAIRDTVEDLVEEGVFTETGRVKVNLAKLK